MLATNLSIDHFLSRRVIIAHAFFAPSIAEYTSRQSSCLTVTAQPSPARIASRLSSRNRFIVMILIKHLSACPQTTQVSSAQTGGKSLLQTTLGLPAGCGRQDRSGSVMLTKLVHTCIFPRRVSIDLLDLDELIDR